MSTQDPEVLRQLTLNQIRQLTQEDLVFVRFVVENATTITREVYGYDTLVMEKQERKRKGPLIKAIRPASFPIAIDLREKYTERAIATIWSTDEGTFYADCGVVWILQAFTEKGEGKSLVEVEAIHLAEAKRRREEENR